MNLFILPRHLGDTIFTTGIIDYCKEEPCVIAATSQMAPLVAELPNLEKVIIIDKQPWKKHWVHLWQETRYISWNRVVSFKRSPLCFLLKANKTYQWRSPTVNTIHRVRKLSTWFGSEEVLSPTLWLSKERLAHHKLNRPTLAVAPMAGWAGKQWPLENLINLLAAFCKAYPEAQVAVFAAPHEKAYVKPLLEALPQDQRIDALGEHILDSAAMIRASRLFIGNDSGLMHVSAAVGTPTIGLFGPTDEHIFGPWSSASPSPHRTLRAEPYTGPATGYVKKRSWDKKNYMTSLTVPMVWEVLQERWEACANK